VLLTAGFDVKVGGNVGVSFCRIIADRPPDIVVLEVSSFQLDNVSSFKPDVAILLNITPDHLDRYDNQMDLYAAVKMKIAQQQGIGDIFIYNGDDPQILSRLSSVQTKAEKMAIMSAMYIPEILNKEGLSFQSSLQGKHNKFNTACVDAAARHMGLDDGIIEEGLKTYKNYPHRLEVVGDIDGVIFINDSKATNTDAVYQALAAMKSPVIWIAGGVDKGNDYNTISALVADKVKYMICLGIQNDKLVALGNEIKLQKPDFEFAETTSISDAIKMAKEVGAKGDTVLLSPACASFDLFKNYEDRGDQFRAAVLAEIKTTI
jgi:UDP-N-acetylmuramoylalanine--D-glutamate ligase